MNPPSAIRGNEWTEGSHLEPCTRFGYGYLEAVRSVFGKAAE